MWLWEKERGKSICHVADLLCRNMPYSFVFQIDKPIKTCSRSWFGFQIHHLSCLSLRNIHRRDNITERSVSPKMIECQDLASYRLLCKPSGCVVLAER